MQTAINVNGAKRAILFYKPMNHETIVIVRTYAWKSYIEMNRRIRVQFLWLY